MSHIMGQECQTVPQCLVTLEKKNNICLKKCVDGHVKHNIFIFCGLIKKKEKRERGWGERRGKKGEEGEDMLRFSPAPHHLEAEVTHRF